MIQLILITLFFTSNCHCDLFNPFEDIGDTVDVVKGNAKTPLETINSLVSNEDPIQDMRQRMDIIEGHLTMAIEICCSIPQSARNSKNLLEVNQMSIVKRMVKHSQQAHCNSTQLMGKAPGYKTVLLKNPMAVTCLTGIESKLSELAAILFPFAHVTSKTPTTGWRLLCGTKCRKGGGLANGINPMSLVTEQAFHLIDDIYVDIEHIEKGESCKVV